MTYKFTNRAEKAIQIANDIANEFGHNYIGTEHLLYGLAKEGTGVASKVLENQGVTSDKVESEIEELIGSVPKLSEETTIGFTPRTKRVIENAFREARKLGSEFIGTEHILIGIMLEGDSIAVRILMDLDVNPQKLYNEIVKGNSEEAIKGLKMMFRKMIAGVVVFLIPSIIAGTIRIISGKEYETSDMEICVTCFNSPSDPVCKQAIDKYNGMEQGEIDEAKEKNKEGVDDSKIEGGEVDTSNMGTSSN